MEEKNELDLYINTLNGFKMLSDVRKINFLFNELDVLTKQGKLDLLIEPMNRMFEALERTELYKEFN